MHYSALIGNPTEHSISHIMFEELAKVANINVPYKHLKIDVVKEDIKNTLEALQVLKFRGINVTLPHKLDVIKYLDKIDTAAKFIGAVNTVKIHDTLDGYNTDWIGIYTPLKEYENRISAVAIFGSGGAARAAIYAAHKLNPEKVFVFYRDDEDDPKTADLLDRSAELNIITKQYKDISKILSDVDLIINATSAGMIGKDKLPVKLEDLANIKLANKLYFDVVFNPVDTPLLLHCKKEGAHTIDGLWMMIYQGIAALEIWLDKKNDLSDNELLKLHDLLVKELGGNV